MKLLFKNIKELVQIRLHSTAFLSGSQMKDLPTLTNAYLLVENGKIAELGEMENCPTTNADQIIDASGRIILPSWCDSHTHLVYAGNREKEFVDRIRGLSYTEIAQRGGGILNSAKILQETSEQDLYEQSKLRLEDIIQSGTGAVEIKSGYGLTPEAELKMLRVIKRLKAAYPILIKSTFLAAHALPQAYKKDKASFLKLMLEEVLPIVAKEGLAEFIDVFCETGYFSVKDTEQILEAGTAFGLIPKIHVNQFTAIGGIQKALEYKALSVDHLEVLREEDINSLKGTTTMPVALPGCSFFLGIPYTPARHLLQADIPIALASDYNPGSAPSGNMNLVLSTACIKLKMTPEEAINAATINGAYAMGVEAEVGSISIGKKANLILTKPIPSYNFLPYSFGSSSISQVYFEGHRWIPN